ncbi:hypothetical protein D3C81_1834130 [compost metagenome]
MVAVIGVLLVFVAVKLVISPVPLAANPIAELSFVHEYVVPDTLELKRISVVESLLHRVCAFTAVITGVGFTVIVKLSCVPGHDAGFAETGVTVMVATTGVFPVFTPVKADILPLPLAASPMLGVSFVQL